MKQIGYQKPCEYYDFIEPYQYVAYLYEKMYGGIIDKGYFYCPLRLRDDEEIYNHYSELLEGAADKATLEHELNVFIEKRELDVGFCNKIRDSKGLRYMITVGFHENYAKDFKIADSECVLRVKCSDEHMPLVKVKKNLAKIIFKDVSKIKYKKFEYFSADKYAKILDDRIEWEKLSLNDFEYNGQYFLYQENDTILFTFELNNNDKPMKTIILEITAQDVELK